MVALTTRTLRAAARRSTSLRSRALLGRSAAVAIVALTMGAATASAGVGVDLGIGAVVGIDIGAPAVTLPGMPNGSQPETSTTPTTPTTPSIPAATTPTTPATTPSTPSVPATPSAPSTPADPSVPSKPVLPTPPPPSPSPAPDAPPLPMPAVDPEPKGPYAPAATTRSVEGQVIVRLQPGVGAERRAALFAAAQATVRDDLQLGDTYVVDVTGTEAEAVASLESEPEVVWAESNDWTHATVEATYGQTDPYWPNQWALDNLGDGGGASDADIDSPISWVRTKGAGVTVAVVDTGVDTAHPDLAGKLVGGVNVVPDGRSSVADGSGHGTHVTGTIVASENTIGVVGAAPAATVLPIRALDDNGTGTSASIASAFAYAGSHGARIVNASVGFSTPSRAVSDAIAAYPRTLFVVAAGNAGGDVDNGGAPTYPCEYPLSNILCVGASDRRDGPASFTNRGSTSVDLFAPGVSVASTTPGGSYDYESGTSMAAPHAAAVAAQVLAMHPSWTAEQVKGQLMDTVDHPAALAGTNATDGRLNAARAVGEISKPTGPPPAGVGGFRATAAVGSAELSWTASGLDASVYQVDRIVNGAWAYYASPFADVTSLTVRDLPPGVPQTFRIRAHDGAGQEGPASASVSVTPLSAAGSAGGASAAPGARPAPIQGATKPKTSTDGVVTALDPAGSAALAVISSVKRKRVKGKIQGVTFKLSAAGSVTVKASPSATKKKDRKKAKAARSLSKTVALRAGVGEVSFGSSAKGVKLTKGTWKLSLSTRANKVSLTVVVR